MSVDMYVFKKPNKEYLKPIDPLNDYIKQSKTFISKFGKDPNILKKVLKNSNIKNPIVEFNHKDQNGDMFVDTMPLLGYIKDVQVNHELIVPSFTTYSHPSKYKSLHSEYIDINVKARAKDKKDLFYYTQIGDKEKAMFSDNMQLTRKIYNNSLSGAYASKSTIICNPSAHYTLTSITRCLSSIGNATTESIVAGNKIFITPESTINYITAIVSHLDYNYIKSVIEKYNMYIPTVDDVMDAIVRSTRWYWNIPNRLDFIRLFIGKLDGVERAMVLYHNDLYHIRKYNDKLIRDLLTAMAKRCHNYSTDYLKDIKDTQEGVMNHVHLVCNEELKGLSVNYEKLVTDNKELIDLLSSTAKNTAEVITKYKDFFYAFIVTDIAPVDIAYIKDMMRETIVLSDTDSTCGSYDEWVKWYFNSKDILVDNKAIGIASSIMLITTQVLDHYIKMFAGRMNVDENKMDLLKMKNEFYWHSFVTMNASKHYFADTAIKEGNVFAKTKDELKGVNLIASKIDLKYKKEADSIRDYVKECINTRTKIDLLSIIKRVKDIELEIIQRIKNGDEDVLSRDMIKEASAYKQDPDKSNYMHHYLWEDVFKDKYGDPGLPPYNVLLVPTILTSNKVIEEYLSTLDNQSIATKLKQFLNRYNKTSLGTFRPPVTLIKGKGLPEEMFNCIDFNRVVKANCNNMYMILESIGFYKPADSLISDLIQYKDL